MEEIKKYIKNNLFYKMLRKSIYPLEKKLAKINCTKIESQGINNSIDSKNKVIVSLTSFPDRIMYVSKTITTLLNQSYKPNIVVLYLSSSQFKQKEEELPEELLRLRKFGLTIKWVEKDIKAYKKLIPALMDFPEDIVVTADDDLYYPQYWLKSLIDSYCEFPNDIHCHLVTKLKVSTDGIRFKDCYRKKGKGESNYTYKILGGSGTLYPPKSLYQDVLKTDLFMKYAPTNDDVWFWIMAVKQGTKVRWIKNNMRRLFYVEGTQENTPCLYLENNYGPNLRLKQMETLIDLYDLRKML